MLCSARSSGRACPLECNGVPRLHKLLKEGQRLRHAVCVASDASFVDGPCVAKPIFKKLDGAINRHVRGEQDAVVMSTRYL